MITRITLASEDAAHLSADMIVCSNKSGILERLVEEIGIDLGGFREGADGAYAILRDRRIVAALKLRRVTVASVFDALWYWVNHGNPLANKSRLVLVPLSWRKPEIVVKGTLLFIWYFCMHADTRRPDFRTTIQFTIASTDGIDLFRSYLDDRCARLQREFLADELPLILPGYRPEFGLPELEAAMAT